MVSYRFIADGITAVAAIANPRLILILYSQKSMKPIHINMAITENTTRPTARPKDKTERTINLRFFANSIYAILTAVTNSTTKNDMSHISHPDTTFTSSCFNIVVIPYASNSVPAILPNGV